MATAKTVKTSRSKAPARLAVLVASGLASATFLYAVVNAPSLTQAGVQASGAAPQTSVNTTRSSVASVIRPQPSVSQATTSLTRVRTRGS
jgi:hypothetical protein